MDIHLTHSQQTKLYALFLCEFTIAEQERAVVFYHILNSWLTRNHLNLWITDFPARDSIRQAVDRRGSFNLIHYRSVFKVDIFLPRTKFDQNEFNRLALHTIPDTYMKKPRRNSTSKTYCKD